MTIKAFVSRSSGKDSAFALHEVRRLGLVEIAGVLTTVNERYDRVAMHGVPSELLDPANRSDERSRDQGPDTKSLRERRL
jgi:diphthamide synthase (EF-2-diphthine--ammonia ligase)